MVNIYYYFFLKKRNKPNSQKISWLTGIKHVNSVNSLVKNSIIDIIQKCIRFESFNSETSLVNQSKFCESIFQFVVEILDQKDNSKNSQMEISSIRTITSLIEFGNITENFLNKKVLFLFFFSS